MSWDDLRFVLEVRRGGSLAKAAKALRVDKATASRRMAALEATLGSKLLARLARGPALTDGGERVARIVAEMEALAATIPGAASTGASGEVKLTAPGWFARHVLIPGLAGFGERNRKVAIRLLATNDVLNLAGKEADVAVRNFKPTQSSMIGRVAGRVGFAAYVSRSYVARNGLPGSRADVKRHHLVGYDDYVVHQKALAWLEKSGAPVAFRATDTLSLLDAVREGIGIGVLPCLLGDEERELSRLSFADRVVDEVYVVIRAESRRDPGIRAAVEWVLALFRENAKRLEGTGHP